MFVCPENFLGCHTEYNQNYGLLVSDAWIISLSVTIIPCTLTKMIRHILSYRQTNQLGTYSLFTLNIRHLLHQVASVDKIAINPIFISLLIKLYIRQFSG